MKIDNKIIHVVKIEFQMKFLVLSGLLALGNAAPQLSPEAAAKAIEQVQFDISQPILPAVCSKFLSND